MVNNHLTLASTPSKRAKISPPPSRKIVKFSAPTALVKLIAFNGSEEKTFVVHEGFACKYSPLLKAAFNSQFLEGQTQTYRLMEATEDVVQLLVQWLYQQDVEVEMLETKK